MDLATRPRSLRHLPGLNLMIEPVREMMTRAEKNREKIVGSTLAEALLPAHFRANPMYEVRESITITNYETPSAEGWNKITVATLDEVQDLLEALEEARFRMRHVRVMSPHHFEVAWK